MSDFVITRKRKRGRAIDPSLGYYPITSSPSLSAVKRADSTMPAADRLAGQEVAAPASFAEEAVSGVSEAFEAPSSERTAPAPIEGSSVTVVTHSERGDSSVGYANNPAGIDDSSPIAVGTFLRRHAVKPSHLKKYTRKRQRLGGNPDVTDHNQETQPRPPRNRRARRIISQSDDSDRDENIEHIEPRIPGAPQNSALNSQMLASRLLKASVLSSVDPSDALVEANHGGQGSSKHRRPLQFIRLVTAERRHGELSARTPESGDVHSQLEGGTRDRHSHPGSPFAVIRDVSQCVQDEHLPPLDSRITNNQPKIEDIHQPRLHPHRPSIAHGNETSSTLATSKSLPRVPNLPIVPPAPHKPLTKLRPSNSHSHSVNSPSTRRKPKAGDRPKQSATIRGKFSRNGCPPLTMVAIGRVSSVYTSSNKRALSGANGRHRRSPPLVDAAAVTPLVLSTINPLPVLRVESPSPVAIAPASDSAFHLDYAVNNPPLQAPAPLSPAPVTSRADVPSPVPDATIPIANAPTSVPKASTPFNGTGQPQCSTGMYGMAPPNPTITEVAPIQPPRTLKGLTSFLESFLQTARNAIQIHDAELHSSSAPQPHLHNSSGSTRSSGPREIPCDNSAHRSHSRPPITTITPLRSLNTMRRSKEAPLQSDSPSSSAGMSSSLDRHSIVPRKLLLRSITCQSFVTLAES